MSPELMRRWGLVAALAATLAACGGGGGTSAVVNPPPSPPPPPPPGTTRGTLMGAGGDSGISTSTINSFGSDGREGPFAPGESASCTVSIRQITYATVQPSGALVTASAGLLVPGGSSACTQGRPLLTFQHGTADSSSFSGADASANLPMTMAKYFVSHGYVVVIPDYLGYGVASGVYHPYVDAEANAATVIDGVRAARNWFASSSGASSGVTLSGQLFLSGTSEGGYVTMATHRTMERDYPSEFAITADVPISGPYDLSTEVLNDLMTGDISGDSSPGDSAFLLTAYQDIYGDLWSSPSQVFQSPWDTTVIGLFPGLYASDSDAMKHCALPKFVDTSPSPPVQGCSTGSNPLLQASFVADYEANHAGTPGGIARAHVAANDLLQGWRTGRNVAPMTVCYGDLDTTAALNATTAASYFGITSVDVQTTGPSFITSWMATASQGASGMVYHGQVEAPGCTAYARYAVFDNYVTVP